MDTPKSAADVEFTRKSRGYDPEEVDRFVSSMQSELSDLQTRLRQVEGAASSRNAKARREGGKLHDPDRAVERMLAAAQQTADRVVFDAEAEADRLVTEAEVEAERLVGDAQSNARHRLAEVEAQGEKIRREAVTEARRVVEETRQPLAREVRKLRSTRDSLRSEIELLKRFLSDHRSRVREVSEALRTLADDPNSLRVAKLGDPIPVDVDVSDDFEIEIPGVPAVVDADDESIDVEPAAVAPLAAPKAKASGPAKVSAAVVDSDVALDAITIDDGEPAASDIDVPARAPKPVVTVEDLETDDTAESDDDPAWADDGDDADDSDDGDDADSGGQVISGAFAAMLDDDGSAPIPGAGDMAVAGSDDKFLSEVRKAAGSDDDKSDGGFFSDQIDDEDDPGRGRFGRS